MKIQNNLSLHKSSLSYVKLLHEIWLKMPEFAKNFKSFENDLRLFLNPYRESLLIVIVLSSRGNLEVAKQNKDIHIAWKGKYWLYNTSPPNSSIKMRHA